MRIFQVLLAFVLLVIMVYQMARAGEMKECHARTPHEGVVLPGGVSANALPSDGYRCTGRDGSMYDELAGDGPLVPREVVTDPTGNRAVLLRPSSRLGDLLRFRLVSPRNWIDDARLASMHSPDYANAVTNRADRVRASCRGRKGGHFVWLGRVNGEGVPAFNLVAHEQDNNPLADCFLERIQGTRLPVAPGAELYEAVGGFPVAYEWKRP